MTLLIHQLLHLVNVGTHFDRRMVDRESVEMLVLGGISLAIAQLGEKIGEIEEKDEKGGTEKSKKDRKKDLEAFLSRVLPHLNRWQVFELDKEIDGIDGELKVCISCENGKININEAFDFKKEDFKPEYKKFLSALKFKGVEKSTGKFLKGLTKLLKKRKKKIDDISQIRQNRIELFYEPPKRTKKVREAKPNTILALQDIFTIWTDSDKLEPLFLSDALCSMFNFRRPLAHDDQLQKETFKKIAKNIKPNIDQNTEKYWNILKPLYKPKSKFKIKNVKIFSTKFEPTTYSVLSSGKVGDVEQRLLAIIRKSSEKNKKKKPAPSFKVVRLYWI
jgi:hypothetical protein